MGGGADEKRTLDKGRRRFWKLFYQSAGAPPGSLPPSLGARLVADDAEVLALGQGNLVEVHVPDVQAVQGDALEARGDAKPLRGACPIGASHILVPQLRRQRARGMDGGGKGAGGAS